MPTDLSEVLTFVRFFALREISDYLLGRVMTLLHGCPPGSILENRDFQSR